MCSGVPSPPQLTVYHLRYTICLRSARMSTPNRDKSEGLSEAYYTRYARKPVTSPRLLARSQTLAQLVAELLYRERLKQDAVHQPWLDGLDHLRFIVAGHDDDTQVWG